MLSKPPNRWIENTPGENEFQKLYIHLCIMKYMLNSVQPENAFTEDLEFLLKKYPNVDPNALGMKENWINEALWSN
ncbi:hypothetical protein GCM10009122_09820 [Fulvivirga kasyanovii]